MKKIFNNYKFFIFSLFTSFSLFLTTFINKESDYMWHVKAGEYMFNHGPIVKDVFSWSLNGSYWMSHEWLFEVIVYALKKLMGNFSLVFYVFICVMTILFIIYIYNKEKMKNRLFMTLLWVVCCSVLICYIQVRPHLVSYILFTSTMYFIYDLINNEASKKIYFLPLLTILWSNLHGGSSNLGYLMCFIVLFAGLFNFRFSKFFAKRLSKKQLLTLLVVGLISVLCTSINIHGFKMTIYPYTNMMDKTMLNNILEWRITDINDITHSLFFVIASLIFFILLCSKKKIKFIDLVLFGVGIFLGLKSIRFWAYLYLISSFFVFDYVEEFEFHYFKYAVMFANVMFICFFIINFNKVYKEVNTDYIYTDSTIINKIKEVKPERLYNIYNVGGELIYYDIPVFIDGRADLYSQNNLFEEYLKIDGVELDFKSQINRFNFDYYLTNIGGKLDNYLISHDMVEKVVSSNGLVLYKKKAS